MAKRKFKLHSRDVHLNLRAIREKLDLTQAQAAAKVGISRLTWQQYEAQSYMPGLPSLLQIVVGLGLGSLDEVVSYNRESILALITETLPTVDKPAGADVLQIEVPRELTALDVTTPTEPDAAAVPPTA